VGDLADERDRGTFTAPPRAIIIATDAIQASEVTMSTLFELESTLPQTLSGQVRPVFRHNEGNDAASTV
jgi:hypothetical protein